MKRQTTDWDKIVAKLSVSLSKKGLWIYKEILQVNFKKTDNSILKTGQKMWTDTSSNKMFRWQVHEKVHNFIRH